MSTWSLLCDFSKLSRTLLLRRIHYSSSHGYISRKYAALFKQIQPILLSRTHSSFYMCLRSSSHTRRSFHAAARLLMRQLHPHKQGSSPPDRIRLLKFPTLSQVENYGRPSSFCSLRRALNDSECFGAKSVLPSKTGAPAGSPGRLHLGVLDGLKCWAAKPVGCKAAVGKNRLRQPMRAHGMPEHMQLTL